MILKGEDFLSVFNVNTNKINKLYIYIYILYTYIKYVSTVPVYIECYGAKGKLGPI